MRNFFDTDRYQNLIQDMKPVRSTVNPPCLREEDCRRIEIAQADFEKCYEAGRKARRENVRRELCPLEDWQAQAWEWGHDDMDSEIEEGKEEYDAMGDTMIINIEIFATVEELR